MSINRLAKALEISLILDVLLKTDPDSEQIDKLMLELDSLANKPYWFKVIVKNEQD